MNLKNRKIKTRLTTAVGGVSVSTGVAVSTGASIKVEEKNVVKLCPNKEAVFVNGATVVLPDQLGGVGGSDLENLQSLVAHLDRKDGPVSALESASSRFCFG